MKEKSLHVKIATFFEELLSIIGFAVVAIAFAFTFLFRTVSVDGGSMNPTLSDADRVIVSAGMAEPKYGDIVVISQPNAMNKTLIKRVIATGGQTVDFKFDDETGICTAVLVDGVPLEENYILEPITYYCFENTFHYEVPEGFVFCMGDNRNNSTDCRSERVGFIDKNYIMGRVLFRIAPGIDFDVAKID